MTGAEIELPADTSKSRLARPAKPEPQDDVATAGERIEAFWEKYPDGSILTEVESREVDAPERLPFSVYTVRAFVRRNAADPEPSSTAHATRSEADPDPITAAFAQETAETSAVSRALRMIGILTVARKPTEGVPEVRPASTVVPADDLRKARKSADLSQSQLAQAMGEHGFPWTQATVSKIERGHRPITADEAPALRELIGYDS